MGGGTYSTKESFPFWCFFYITNSTHKEGRYMRKVILIVTVLFSTLLFAEENVIESNSDVLKGNKWGQLYRSCVSKDTSENVIINYIDRKRDPITLWFFSNELLTVSYSYADGQKSEGYSLDIKSMDDSKVILANGFVFSYEIGKLTDPKDVKSFSADINQPSYLKLTRAASSLSDQNNCGKGEGTLVFLFDKIN